MSIIQAAGAIVVAGFVLAGLQLAVSGAARPNWMGLGPGRRPSFYRLHGFGYLAFAASALVTFEGRSPSLVRPVLGLALALVGLGVVVMARRRENRRQA